MYLSRSSKDGVCDLLCFEELKAAVTLPISDLNTSRVVCLDNRSCR